MPEPEATPQPQPITVENLAQQLKEVRAELEAMKPKPRKKSGFERFLSDLLEW